MKRLICGLLACVIMVAANRPCAASLQLMLDDGVNPSITVIDGMAGDINPIAGVVTWIGSIGVWTANVSTGMGAPILGSLTFPELDLNSVNNSSAGGMLTLKLTQTDNTGTLPGIQAAVGGTLDMGGTIDYKTYVNSSNLPFDTSGGALTSQIFTGSPAFSGIAGSAVVGITAPYSLTQIVKITHTSDGVTSFDAKLDPLPEPTTALIWGGLALAGFGAWRTRRHMAA
jgi:hypothetical protein